MMRRAIITDSGAKLDSSKIVVSMFDQPALATLISIQSFLSRLSSFHDAIGFLFDGDSFRPKFVAESLEEFIVHA